VSVHREWFEKDYYKVLGVPPNASERDITRAYRKLAKQFHPDANPGAEEKFKEISSAYDVLGDPAKRKEYDEVRKHGLVGAGAGARGGSFNFRLDDLGDLFSTIFTRSRQGGGTGAFGGPQRGQDLEAELHIDFKEAIEGVTTVVNVTSEAVCSACGGTGAAKGTKPSICLDCQGRGVLDDNQGLFSFSRPCPSCNGRGIRIEKECPTCRGTGIEHRPRQVKVRVPPGVDNGQKIRIKGRGGPGTNNGPPGDLFVTVHVRRHPIFGRRGKDLTITIPLTYPEAVLGTTVTVPTLEKPVKVKIPAGTPSGKTFRVKGRGIPKKDGTGDLLVTVEVVVPKELNDDQRQAIEALARATYESPRHTLEAQL
jgi:molecular chaperone DnaJ